jgi:hypothetical protein
VRQQQVMAHHRAKCFDVRRPQPEAVPDLLGERGTHDAVVAAATLAQVVEQRAEQE